MRKLASLLVAKTFVCVIWAFVDMPFFTLAALFTVAKGREGPADRGTGGHADVCVATLRVRASLSKEVHTSGGAVGGGLMGKITAVTCAALASLKEILADCNFVWIMSVVTRGSFVACTWNMCQRLGQKR